MQSVKEIFDARIRMFDNMDYIGLYDLYSPSSQFKQFFTSLESYKYHFNELAKEIKPISIEIYSVDILDSRATVLFCEKVKLLDKDIFICYYGRSRLIKIDNVWKIEEEVRELSSK